MCQAQLRYYVRWPTSFPQFLCDLGYETLRCITDTSNLNLCLKLSSRFPHTQIYFDAFPIKVFPLLGKVFPSLLSPSSQDHLWFFSFLPLHLQYLFESVSYTSECIQLHHLRLGRHRPLTSTHCRSFQLCLTNTFYVQQMPEGAVKIDCAIPLLKTIL